MNLIIVWFMCIREIVHPPDLIAKTHSQSHAANHRQGQQQQQPQEVFRENFAYICRTVQNNVTPLAHEAYSQGMILSGTHSEVLNKSTPSERATVFILALEDSIKSEPTRLEKFVEILKESDTAYYSTLINKLSSTSS